MVRMGNWVMDPLPGDQLSNMMDMGYSWIPLTMGKSWESHGEVMGNHGCFLWFFIMFDHV